MKKDNNQPWREKQRNLESILYQVLFNFCHQILHPDLILGGRFWGEMTPIGTLGGEWNIPLYFPWKVNLSPSKQWSFEGHFDHQKSVF